MFEADKIRHIMKGIEDDAFQMLIAKNPQTVTDVVQYCQNYDELQKQRISTCLPSSDTANMLALTVGAVSTGTTMLMRQIQQFVQEEVARQLSLVSCVLDSAQALAQTLRQAIEEHTSEALPTTYQHPPVSAPLTYVDVTCRQSPAMLPSTSTN